MIEDTQTLERFTVQTTRIHRPYGYDTLVCDIYDNGVQIGSYARNYSLFYSTFYPFQQNGQFYALYSPKFSITRVMSLPSCQDLGGEDLGLDNFCPVEYTIPFGQLAVNSSNGDYHYEDFNARFGFIAGSLFADSPTRQIQYLDLTRVSEGIITRAEKFGYIDLFTGMKLKDAVDIDQIYEPETGRAHIASSKLYVF